MKYIFEVEIKPGYSIEEYARVWCEVSKIIQTSQGASGTYLHRNINEPNKLLAIAHWQSKTARDQKDDSHDDIIDNLLREQKPYCEITVIGEFEEPDWQVLPPKTDN